MTRQTSASLLATTLWDGKLFTGQWRAGSLEAATVVEPATGGSLGRIGMADPALVAA